jgi:MiaB/RimO family radical SAM methylthiotransferase
VPRRRLDGGPTAPLKIASGCDRRCAFCAIPSFRGSYLSRPIDEIVAEARWLAADGVKEVVLVSENSSSYGKDLPGADLVGLLRALDEVDGLEWIRISYLQPAEVRPDLVAAICDLERVVPYFDLPFQHASGPVLRRMRRFGDADSFLGLLDVIRDREPQAGVRSNVILGFPGETEADVAVLTEFLAAARLDAVGVFGYSDEEGTEGATLPGKVSEAEIADRVEQVTALVDELLTERAAERVGDEVRFLVEERADAGFGGRIAQQGPETDGAATILGLDTKTLPGTLGWGRVASTDGVDLVVEGRR